MTEAQREFTPQELVEILGINENSLLNENEVVRDRYTGRIVSGPDGGNVGNNVVFTTEAVVNKLLTWQNGGVPQYVDMDFVTITSPGLEKYFSVHRPVTEFDIFSYPQEYKNFKDGQAASVVGMPLSLWPLMTPSQIKEFEYIGVRTVEQVAALSDTVQSVRAAPKLRQMAKEFLAQAHDTAAQGLLQKQLDDVKSANAAEIAALKAQVAELAAIAEQANKKAPVKKEA